MNLMPSRPFGASQLVVSGTLEFSLRSSEIGLQTTGSRSQVYSDTKSGNTLQRSFAHIPLGCPRCRESCLGSPQEEEESRVWGAQSVPIYVVSSLGHFLPVATLESHAQVRCEL